MKILRVIFLIKTENWLIVKEIAHWTVVKFTDTENLDTGSHNFYIDFKTKLRKILAKFTFC